MASPDPEGGHVSLPGPGSSTLPRDRPRPVESSRRNPAPLAVGLLPGWVPDAAGLAPEVSCFCIEVSNVPKPLVHWLIAAGASVLAFAASGADPSFTTSGTVMSRLGELKVKIGYPTPETAARLHDDIDFQRASQGYLWGLPLMAMARCQSEQREKFGAGNLDYVDYLTFKDKLGLLTANATTPYVMAFPNMKDTGPLVIEIPAGAMAGGILDFWQRPLTDTSPDRLFPRHALAKQFADRTVVSRYKGY